jgi:hypothetical protein
MNYIVGVNVFLDINGNRTPITTSYHAVEAQDASEAKHKAVKWFVDGDVKSVKINAYGDIEYIDKFRSITYRSIKATMASPADVFNFFAVTSGLSDALIIGDAKEQSVNCRRLVI